MSAPEVAPAKARYEIQLQGCDDSTTVQMDLLPAEADLLSRLAAAVAAASEFGCQPTLKVEEATP